MQQVIKYTDNGTWQIIRNIHSNFRDILNLREQMGCKWHRLKNPLKCDMPVKHSVVGHPGIRLFFFNQIRRHTDNLKPNKGSTVSLAH